MDFPLTDLFLAAGFFSCISSCPLKEWSILLCTKAFDVYFPSRPDCVFKNERSSIRHKWASLVFQLSGQSENFLTFVSIELFFKRGLISSLLPGSLNLDGAFFLFDILFSSVGLHANNQLLITHSQPRGMCPFIISLANMLSVCIICSIDKSIDLPFAWDKSINFLKPFSFLKQLLLLWTRIVLVFPSVFWDSEVVWLIHSIKDTFSIKDLNVFYQHLTRRPFSVLHSTQMVKHLDIPPCRSFELEQRVLLFINNHIGYY